MKGRSGQIGRGLVVGVAGLVMALSLGCRKSKSSREEEQREELNRQQERELRVQQTSAANRRQYEHAKELIGQRRYDEAWKEFEDVAGRDETIKFEFDVYKSETLPEQLFNLADTLSSIKHEQFNEAYRALVFVRDHIEKKRAKAERKIADLRHLKRGHDLYKGALARINAYQRAEGIRMLEEVRDNFGDTPYGDMAILRLHELEGSQPQSSSPH